MSLALPVLGWLALIPLAWWISRLDGFYRIMVSVSSLVLTASLPFLTPGNHYAKFGYATLCSLFLLRFLEVSLKRSPSPDELKAYLPFSTYFLAPGDITFVKTKEDQRAQHLEQLQSLGRGTLKLAFVFVLLVLHTLLPQIHHHWIGQHLWLLFLAYFSFSGAVDLHSISYRFAFRVRLSPAFNAPYLARSPRDFWSRRWNLTFRALAHRSVFLPLGGAKRPLVSVLAVFMVSAAIHEMIVLASVGESRGEMSAFFGLQCLATLVSGFTARASSFRFPKPVAIILHMVWLTLSAPLFFSPFLKFASVQTWVLW